MADAPYIGELRLFSGTIPQGWLPCDGTVLPIAQNQPLFALIGTTYGGNGQTNFAVPDMRGKVGVGFQDGGAYPIGVTGGTPAVTLTSEQMPAHNHTAFAAGATGNLPSPSSNNWGPQTGENIYSPTQAGQMAPLALGFAGSNQGHDNMQPYLSVTWAICLQGIFPNRN